MADRPTSPDLRLAALRRVAVAISALNLAGHAFLGFEQSWAQVLVALATAYGMEILLEVVDAWANGRRTYLRNGLGAVVDFLLPSHITGLAVTMLLYANDRLFPIAFATAVAVGSKALFRAPVGLASRHFFNPSNFGIATTLLLFPWVSIAPPYQFTENIAGALDWLFPAVIVISGTVLNGRYTGRLPLIASWLTGFAAQALARSLIFGTPLIASLVPMTGMAFVLFTFYMVPDPGTTPIDRRAQVAFGAAVAAVYGLLMAFHVVFGLFFALVIVCALRGLLLYALALRRARVSVELPVPATLGSVEH